jgi:hypothetical protein
MFCSFPVFKSNYYIENQGEKWVQCEKYVVCGLMKNVLDSKAIYSFAMTVENCGAFHNYA